MCKIQRLRKLKDVMKSLPNQGILSFESKFGIDPVQTRRQNEGRPRGKVRYSSWIYMKQRLFDMI